MVRDGGLEEVEPEERELGEDLAFVGNSAAQDMVEGGDAVAGDEEKLIAGERVDVADLAAGGEGKRAEIGLEKSCWHHVDGTTSLDSDRVGITKLEELIFEIPGGSLGQCGQRAITVRGVGPRQGEGGEGVALPRVEWNGSEPCDGERERRAG